MPLNLWYSGVPTFYLSLTTSPTFPAFASFHSLDMLLMPLFSFFILWFGMKWFVKETPTVRNWDHIGSLL